MAAYILGFGASALWLVILALSDRAPGHGPWPPRRGNIITALWAWGLTIGLYAGLVQTWGQAPVIPDALRYAIGLPLAVAGSVLHSWATATLGLKATSGWEGGVNTTGPYALCRHPQYLGQIASFLGLALWIGAPSALILGLVASAVLLYGSAVEDRALASRHPAAMAAYRTKTPFLVPAVSRQ